MFDYFQWRLDIKPPLKIFPQVVYIQNDNDIYYTLSLILPTSNPTASNLSFHAHFDFPILHKAPPLFIFLNPNLKTGCWHIQEPRPVPFSSCVFVFFFVFVIHHPSIIQTRTSRGDEQQDSPASEFSRRPSRRGPCCWFCCCIPLVNSGLVSIVVIHCSTLDLVVFLEPLACLVIGVVFGGRNCIENFESFGRGGFPCVENLALFCLGCACSFLCSILNSQNLSRYVCVGNPQYLVVLNSNRKACL